MIGCGGFRIGWQLVRFPGKVRAPGTCPRALQHPARNKHTGAIFCQDSDGRAVLTFADPPRRCTRQSPVSSVHPAPQRPLTSNAVPITYYKGRLNGRVSNFGTVPCLHVSRETKRDAAQNASNLAREKIPPGLRLSAPSSPGPACSTTVKVRNTPGPGPCWCPHSFPSLGRPKHWDGS